MSNWIKKGLPVVNITNTDLVMTVDHPIFQGKKVKVEGGFQTISRLVGIECKVVNESGGFDKSVHHSKELVPLSIATKGKLECYKFINREDEYENY